MEDIYTKASKLGDKDFKQLIGVSKATFCVMLKILTSAYQKQHLKGGRPRKLSMENQLILTLRYLRHYPTQRLLAFDFEVPVATVHDTIVWVEDTLHKDGRFKIEDLQPEHDIAFDVTESPIERPKKINATIILVKRSDTR